METPSKSAPLLSVKESQYMTYHAFSFPFNLSVLETVGGLRLSERWKTFVGNLLSGCLFTKEIGDGTYLVETLFPESSLRLISKSTAVQHMGRKKDYRNHGLKVGRITWLFADNRGLMFGILANACVVRFGGLSMGPVSFFLVFLLSLLLSFTTEGAGHPPSFPPHNGTIANCPPSALLLPNSTGYPICSPFHCNTLGSLRFPFNNESQRECGLITVNGCREEITWIRLEPEGRAFLVKNISDRDSMVISNRGLLGHKNKPDCEFIKNLTSSFSLKLAPTLPVLTMFKCQRSLNTNFTTEYTYNGCGDDFIIHYNHPNSRAPIPPLPPPPKCSIIQYPVDANSNMSDLAALLNSYITLQLHITGDFQKCYYGKNQCQDDEKAKIQCPYVTVAAVKEHREETDHQPKPPNRKSMKLVLGIAISVTGTGVLLALIFCFKTWIFWGKQTQKDLNVEAFLRNHGSLAPRRYHYSEVKKMTSSFKDGLGEGGFGVVYKGKLPDGPLVAVKVLSETKGNGEEFINEIASISRTSHVNIVSLLGYCFHSSKRALIYEFMPNGSLDKFIYERNSSRTKDGLGWKALYNIAIGIARGLQYLHRGCNARILHLDIKPHNILLDENFCPKISDFGLSKLCTRKESIISMSGARGTAGYIAPEVFSRSFGDVSHKSDVYSYGMMVLEMVGGRKNIDVEADHTSEIYFPHWIYKRLELDEELGLRGLRNEEERTSTRKMIIVGLWCIQTNPFCRPSISEVVDMLQGSLGSLQIPPKPFLYSPPRSMQLSSTATHHSLQI